jgi:Domain of unknown function (DUF4189)
MPGNQYGAIAVRYGDNVSAGIATRGSQDSADAAAINNCSQRGGGCAVRFRFWHGPCGYVAIPQ